jgi:hypothetical protein
MKNSSIKFDPNKTIAMPCGLMARSTFDDTYKLYRCPLDTPKCELKTGGSGIEIPINRTNISFPSDHTKYKNIDVQLERKKNKEFDDYLNTLKE